MTETVARQRLDKWLFFARVVKSRSLAARLVQAERVRVNGDKVKQASHQIKPGDVLTVTLERRILVLKVCDGGERRNPASQACKLYEDLSAPRRDDVLRDGGTFREPGSGRPTKRERRATDRLRGMA